MNIAETHDLLTLIATYDNRRFDDAAVLAWAEIVSDVPFADGRQAVVRHFSESTAWLMPAHIRRFAAEFEHERRRANRERIERAAIAAEADDPTRRDRSPEVQALLDDLRERLGPGKPDVFRRPEWVENDKRREREARAESNPHYVAIPPEGGWPVPEELSPA